MSQEEKLSTITTKDGTEIYYKDWKDGQPVVFSHGWPLNADSWESQMEYLASCGYRCIAHDRRGHGRSSQPWNGNDMDTYADDLKLPIETLKLDDIVLFGFSVGGGEIARYIGRHGTDRIAKAGLIAAVTPLMLQTASNSDGLPVESGHNPRQNTQAIREFQRRCVAWNFLPGWLLPGVLRPAYRAASPCRPSSGIAQSVPRTAP